MDSTTTVRRLLAAGSALFVSRVPAGGFAHGGKVHLIPGWVSKTMGGGAMSRHLCLAVLVILGLLLGGRHVAQAASFTFTPIDPSGAFFTRASGINPSGQIVGTYVDSTGEHGFLATPKRNSESRRPVCMATPSPDGLCMCRVRQRRRVGRNILSVARLFRLSGASLDVP